MKSPHEAGLGMLGGYHQDQYPEIHAEEVAETIRNVFGEVAARKIAHSQKLVKKVAVQTLDAEYRNECSGRG